MVNCVCVCICAAEINLTTKHAEYDPASDINIDECVRVSEIQSRESRLTIYIYIFLFCLIYAHTPNVTKSDMCIG